MTRPAIVVGGGGQAQVVIDVLRLTGHDVLAVADAALAGGSVCGVPVAGDDAWLLSHDPAAVVLANPVGSAGPSTVRARIFSRFVDMGFAFATLVHSAAVVARDAGLELGAQVMAETVHAAALPRAPRSVAT